ncbi:hypothetical protein [Aeromicrobium sp. 179-A 4D2 NHS]|uniref:hypothetical protein n=1 Tax=Aeromicrobium sp. 179-A 4D2 NHS TaxID=3142375 RepID=UPI00399F0F1F
MMQTLAVVETAEELEALPYDAVVESGGRPAIKGESGAWWYADGQAWEPALPANVLFLPET